MDLLRSVCACFSCFSSPNLVIYGRRLRIEKLIGEGGFSYVYLVEDAEGEQYALKKIRCPFGAESVANVMREVEATKMFDSPLVISQVDSLVRQEADGSKIVYILLPYYRKGSLQDRINELAINGEHMAESEVLSWARGLAKALRVMHRYRAAGPGLETEFAREEDGLLATFPDIITLGEVTPWAHRDVKPANVMVDDNGRAVLMDLGSCAPARIPVKSSQEALKIQDKVAELCTLPYRAPELVNVRSGMLLSEKVDIWSYGCTIYALMYLISPFEKQERDTGANLTLAIQNRSFVFPEDPHFSAPIRKLIRECLSIDPLMRPTVDDILDLLDSM